jgi:hypothetical protein
MSSQREHAVRAQVKNGQNKSTHIWFIYELKDFLYGPAAIAAGAGKAGIYTDVREKREECLQQQNPNYTKSVGCPGR